MAVSASANRAAVNTGVELAVESTGVERVVSADVDTATVATRVNTAVDATVTRQRKLEYYNTYREAPALAPKPMRPTKPE